MVKIYTDYRDFTIRRGVAFFHGPTISPGCASFGYRPETTWMIPSSSRRQGMRAPCL